MAIRVTNLVRVALRRIRPAVLVGVLTAVAVLIPTVASATPAAPSHHPSINQVQKRLGRLALRNTQLVEKYNSARVLVKQREKEARDAGAALDRMSAAYQAANVAFARTVQARYQAGSLGAAGALLESRSDSDYIDRLSTLDLISQHEADIVGRVQATHDAAARQAATTQRLLDEAKQQRDRMEQEKTKTRHEIDKYRTLLATLNSQQRVDYQRALNPSVSAPSLSNLPGAGSAAAHTAVRFALAQVGKPYVFGAAGPSSYDCSGLTMAAWGAAGVSLPHSAADQYNYGTHVSLGQLQPGDLIFLYQPIGHVTIYIGDGMMVSAPTEGENVSVVPLSSFMSDVVGATRLG